MIAPLLALALASLSVRAQADGPAATEIVFETSPAIDFYFHVRAVAASGGKTTVSAFGPAVEQAKELDRALGGSFLAWGSVEGLLPGCKSAADLQRVFASAPETIELRTGAKVPLRERATKLADALVTAEPTFLETWKRREPRIVAARAGWEATVGPKARELLDFHMKSLGMADPRLSIPVHLVLDAPFPGAVTHRDARGEGVCFVAVGGAPPTQLYETILHEATHALDIASRDESALGQVRKLMTTAGIDARDRLARDLPHTLMFVQSAESIRRIIDPAHKDYGEVSKYYERSGPSAEAVRGFWRDHLDGKLERDDALAKMVESVKPAK